MPTIVTPRQLQQRAELYYQLGSLTTAGITLIQALDTLRKKPVRRDFSAPLSELILHLESGSTFTEAMRRLGQWMPAFDIALLNAGEQSGRLDQCFRLLADHYRTRAQLTREVIAGLTYPALVFLFFVMIFPLNALSGLVLRGEVAPFVTSKLMVLAPLAAIALLFAGALRSEHGERWRATIEKLLHRVPILGGARRDLALARLAAALEALINAGVGIIESWTLAADASGSPALKRAVAAWQPELHAGRTPAQELSECEEFPELFANLYHSGEMSGQLDVTLRRLHGHYLDEGRLKFQSLAKWVPRLLYVVLMLVIAWQIISTYGDIFRQGAGAWE